MVSLCNVARGQAVPVVVERKRMRLSRSICCLSMSLALAAVEAGEHLTMVEGRVWVAMVAAALAIPSGGISARTIGHIDIPEAPGLATRQFPGCAMSHTKYADFNDKKLSIKLCLADLRNYYDNIVKIYGYNLTRYCNRIHIVNANVKNSGDIAYQKKVAFNRYVIAESEKCAQYGEYRVVYSSNEQRVKSQVSELVGLLARLDGRRIH